MSQMQTSSIPDTLFKYVDANGGLEILKGAEVSVMFSKPSDLNDPFEFLPALDEFVPSLDEFPDETVHLAPALWSAKADDLRHDIELHWFVTSLTRADRNVRMWAQYAGNHSGIKFTFNLTSPSVSDQKKSMQEVDYSQLERVRLERLLNQNLTVVQKAMLMKQVATRKGRDWEHEEEIRWFLRDDESNIPNSKCLVNGCMRAFLKLPHECIRRVTVGYLSSPSLLRSVLELRKMHKASWEVARSTLSLNSFQFEEQLVGE